MNYLKYTQHLYLVVALFFIFDAYTRWNDTQEEPWVHLFMAAMAIFMFFFRRRFANKINTNK